MADSRSHVLFGTFASKSDRDLAISILYIKQSGSATVTVTIP